MNLRILASLSATIGLAACVSEAPGPAAMVYPGNDKTLAAFQQDQAVCQQHAAFQTGYGQPGTASAGIPSTGTGQPPAAPPPATATGQGQPTNDPGFMQCMASRGDRVQMVPAAPTTVIGSPYANAPYPYSGYSYPYATPGYGLAVGGLGFFGGFGFHHGFHRDGFHQGGFHPNGLHGGFHGGGFRPGGFHHGGGFHGGFHGGGHH